MLQEARFHRIKALLTAHGEVSTERLVRDLLVSRETIRRDLQELETEGALRRVHGGGVALDIGGEAPLAVRQASRAREKKAIARAAVRLLSPGQTLLIDAGTTTAQLAEELSALAGLTVITNGLDVARTLNRDEHFRKANEVILLGGRLLTEAPATSGDLTIAEIQRYSADVALLSPVGICASHGASSFERSEAEVARAMVASARRCVILADHSKIGQRSRIAYASLAAIDTVVTDGGARRQPGLDELQKAGCAIAFA
ncbi:DeoR/GlpR family DNA-binding transcription regulator [Variovorax sp. OV329]|uniref:DeoR/GlpR family DNA-binding transcription regulator n=1 Tax=Variovorax sp. OV329 TaxID=1882825 RepID=UPI0008EB3276|nr:DeoR/GlpR family DNA-binding transcription regulator [Variovorax sp. OV329]SFN27490.1 transcriptional regulator, DeoR family [Variovorax sp. OV329]